MIKAKQLWAVAVVAVVFSISSSMASAAGPEFEDSTLGRQVVLVTGSTLMSVVYTPFKAGYFAVSTGAAALTMVATLGQGDETAARMWRRGVGGDWYVHPDVLTGNRDLRFFGSPITAP